MLVTDRVDRIPARLVFTTGLDPFQLLVGVTTGSKATHAAIGIGDDQLLHAYEPGVLLESRDEFLRGKKQTLVAEFAVLPDVTDGIYEALSHVGKRYDVAHVIKIGLLRLLRPFTLRLWPEREDRFTCARFAMLLDPYGEAIPEWRDVWREAVVPADLLDRALVGPSFVRLS